MTRISPTRPVSLDFSAEQYSYVIGKKNARFKQVDFSTLSSEKMAAYANRFVKVTKLIDGTAQVFIGPNAPHQQELMNNLINLTLEGLSVVGIGLLTAEEYDGLLAANTDLFKSTKKAEKEVIEKEPKEEKPVGKSSLTKINIRSSSTAKDLSFGWHSVLSSLNQCYHKCTQRLIEIFNANERIQAEKDAEADEKKREYKKEVAKENLISDILHDEKKFDERKQTTLKEMLTKALFRFRCFMKV